MYLLGNAQIPIYPTSYSISPLFIGFINPAFNSNSYNKEILLTDQRFFSPFNSFTNKRFGFKWLVKKNDTTNLNQKILFKAFNEQQGSYITKNRVGVGYGITKYIKDSVWLSAGANLGIVNYNFKGNDALTTGSDIAADGDVGLAVGSKKYLICFSSNQIFNSKLKPINATFIVKRYWLFYAQREFIISESFKTKLFAQSLIYTGNSNQHEFGFLFFIHNHISVGINYVLKNKSSFQFCLNEINTKFGSYNFIVSYATPTSINSNYKIQSLDISLIGNFKKIK